MWSAFGNKRRSRLKRNAFLTTVFAIPRREQAMKRIVMPAAIILAAFLLVCLVGGCSGDETGKKPSSPVYGKGQTFTTTDDTYVLDDILFAPKYDSDTAKGYAVIFLKRKPTAPISFSASSLGGGAAPARPRSLADCSLLEGENTIGSQDIEFGGNGEGSEYQGKMTVYFRVQKGQEFPSKGVFTKKDKDATKSYQIDFSGIKVTRSL